MLPVAWGSRTNGCAPELSVKSERPGDWTAHTLASKYKVSEIEEEGSDAPLGWGKRNNTKSLEELSQSTSATVVAVAEVHDKHASASSLFFEGKGGTNSLATAITSNNTTFNKTDQANQSNQEMQMQYNKMLQMVQLLSGVVIKMDTKITELGVKQEQILLLLQQHVDSSKK